MNLRSFTWRFGRKLYSWARHDLKTSPNKNGEYWLFDAYVSASSKTHGIVAIDVGANKGDWSAYALSATRVRGVDLSLHIFEPASDSFNHLCRRFQVEGLVLNNIAISSKETELALYINGPLSGVNSIHGSEANPKENVQALTLDSYITKTGLPSVNFIKSDTEGHDMHVLYGAEKILTNERVDVIQFEYNHRWIDSRYYLKDVFEFIKDKPYMLGKLHFGGIEIFETWHPELERFFESNYVLVRKNNKFLRNYLQPIGFDYANAPIVRRGFQPSRRHSD